MGDSPGNTRDGKGQHKQSEDLSAKCHLSSDADFRAFAGCNSESRTIVTAEWESVTALDAAHCSLLTANACQSDYLRTKGCIVLYPKFAQTLPDLAWLEHYSNFATVSHAQPLRCDWTIATLQEIPLRTSSGD